MTHKQVIIMRKDLNMRKGKMVAQGAHASLGAVLSLSYRDTTQVCDLQRIIIPMDERIEPWLNGTFTKVCLSVNNEQELRALKTDAERAGIITCLIEDNGLTEFHGVKTTTCLAIGPDLKSKIDAITGHLPLL